MFAVDSQIVTPAGTGQVVYSEDDYIEVLIAGNEVSFESPFHGSMTMEEVEAEAQAAKEFADQKARQELESVSTDEIMAARLKHEMSSALVTLIGGSAASWDDLSDEQKLNFVKVKI